MRNKVLVQWEKARVPGPILHTHGSGTVSYTYIMLLKSSMLKKKIDTHRQDNERNQTVYGESLVKDILYIVPLPASWYYVPELSRVPGPPPLPKIQMDPPRQEEGNPMRDWSAVNKTIDLWLSVVSCS